MRCRRAGRRELSTDGYPVPVEHLPELGRSRYPVPVEHLPELGRSRYRWMRAAVAGRQDFRVQPEDRGELGAVDAGVADESKEFYIPLE